MADLTRSDKKHQIASIHLNQYVKDPLILKSEMKLHFTQWTFLNIVIKGLLKTG